MPAHVDGSAVHSFHVSPPHCVDVGPLKSWLPDERAQNRLHDHLTVVVVRLPAGGTTGHLSRETLSKVLT